MYEKLPVYYWQLFYFKISYNAINSTKLLDYNPGIYNKNLHLEELQSWLCSPEDSGLKKDERKVDFCSCFILFFMLIKK